MKGGTDGGGGGGGGGSRTTLNHGKTQGADIGAKIVLGAGGEAVVQGGNVYLRRL